MKSTTLNAIQSLTVVAAAVLVAACSSDKVVAPELVANLGSCPNLQVPPGTTPASHVYATGVQVYRWDGAAWVLITPSAVLTADAAGTSTIGIHYAGPTWEGISGSKVVGSVIDRCTPDANAIPWLLLGAVASDEPGVFQQATFIHRVNTVGGKAPAAPGSVTGEVTSVPYTAEYFFYRPQ